VRTKGLSSLGGLKRAAGFFDAEGNFTGSLVVLTDITLRRQLEEALRQAHLESKRRMEELVAKRTAELMRANELLQHEIEERKQTEKQVRRLSQEVIKAQEVERQRIAADLHDRLAQDLASLKVGLDTLYAGQPDTPDERRQKFSELSGLLEHTLMAVRDKAYGLHPPSLKEFGLAYTVQQYCEEFAGKNSLRVDFFSVGMDDLELDFDTEIAFYRLVQEGLTNIRKHADASHVIVRLSASFSHIMLHIEDNGKGFEVNNRLAAALDERRMGIWSMEQRVAFLHGEMKIESGRMHGTKILIKVPHMDETNG
jgi:signal transduction histidine kinase